MRNRKERKQHQSPNPGASRQTTLVPESPSLPGQDPTPLTPAVLLRIQGDAPSDPPSAFEAGKGEWIPKSSGTLSSSPGKLSSPGKYSSSPPSMERMPISTVQSPKLSSSPTSTSPSSHRRQSSYDFPLRDVLLRQDSRLSIYSPVPETTMDNLFGVTM